MQCLTAYFRGVNRNTFRAGEWARITGVVIVKPRKNMELRPCFQVEYSDGKVDYFPLSDYREGVAEISDGVSIPKEEFVVRSLPNIPDGATKLRCQRCSAKYFQMFRTPNNVLLRVCDSCGVAARVQVELQSPEIVITPVEYL